MEIPPPIMGVNTAAPLDKMPPLTTGDMMNMRPLDLFERRLRLSQRPGLGKMYTEQIGGLALPVVIITSITAVD